jgi:hypothetical protein
MLNGKFYDLAVAKDGTSIKMTEVVKIETGMARLMNRSPLCRGVVISDGTQAYHILGQTKIPAGKYSLVYGLFASGNQEAIMMPVEKELPVTAGKLNSFRLGTPVRINFNARIFRGKLTILPTFPIVGLGGEFYRFVPDLAGQPVAELKEGKQMLGGGKFEPG